MRTIRYERNIDFSLQELGINYKRFDELIETLQEVLCTHPEMYPVIPATKLSICRTNEFAGMSFSDIPKLTLYFHYDANHIYVLEIEECRSESYGL